MGFVDQLTGRERTISYSQDIEIHGRIVVNGVRLTSSGSYIAGIVDNVQINGNNAIYLSARRTVGSNYEWDYGVRLVTTTGTTTVILGTAVVAPLDLWVAIDIDATGNATATETLVEYRAIDGFREVWKPGTTNGLLVTIEGETALDTQTTVPAGVYTNVPIYYAPYFAELLASSTNPYLYDGSGLNPVWRSVGASVSAPVIPSGDGWTTAPNVNYTGSGGSVSTYHAATGIPPQWTNDETYYNTGPQYDAHFKMNGYFPTHEVTVKGRVRNMDVASDVPHDLLFTIGGTLTHTQTGVVGEADYTRTVGGWGMLFEVTNSPTNFSKASTWDNAGAEIVPFVAADYKGAVAITPGVTGQSFFWRHPAKDSFTLTQAATKPLLPPWAVGTSNGNQWRNNGFLGPSTMSVVSSPGGNALRVTATTSQECYVATGLLNPERKAGYHWYTIRCRSVGSANVTFLCGGARVTTGADGVWVDVEIDIFDFIGGSSFDFAGAYDRSLLTVAPRMSGSLCVPGNRTIEVESINGLIKHGSSATALNLYLGSAVGNPHCFTDGWCSLSVNSFPVLANIAAVINYINAYTDSTGWSAVSLRPASTYPTDIWADNQAPAIIEGLGFDNSGAMAIDIPSPATLRAMPLVVGGIQFYAGAGDVQGSGSYGFSTSVVLDYHTGAMVSATMRGNESATVNYTIPSLSNENRGSDGAVDGWADNTGSPYARVSGVPASTPAHRIDNNVSGSLPWILGSVSPVTGQKHYQFAPLRVRRYWVAWDVPPSLWYGAAITIDSPRQLAYVGKGKRIAAYHIATFAMAYQSAEYTIQGWESLSFDERKSLLVAVGKVTGADTRKTYISRDGGNHITEVLSMTAKSAQVQAASELGLIVELFQDSDNTLKRKVSRDSGTTWAAAEAIVVDGAGKSGVVQGMDFNARAGGILLATIKAVSADTVTVIRSRDCGKNWVTVVS